MSESYQKFAIVYGDSAQSLTDQLNAKLYELRGKHPSVSFEGMIARICWEETDYEPEPEEDETKLELTCQDCPYFQPMLKADGTIDGRSRIGDCPHAKYKRTYRNSKPCEKLINDINNGEVKLCLAESEEK